MIESYTWAGGTEPMSWSGPDAQIQVILIQPLFDEANRLRKTLSNVKHGLHALGFGVTLPDFPGTGESLTALHDNTLDDMRTAVRSLVAQRKSAKQSVILASFRGGALIDTCLESDGVWRLAPDTGARFLRDMSRTVSVRHHGLTNDEIYDRAGYALPRGFLADLEAAVPVAARKLRIARLAQDPNDADVRIPGAPLWRRSEPGEDSELTQAIIDDISSWATKCATA